MYRVSKKNLLVEKKILTKIECCGAKFAHEHDLGALDPAFSLSMKPPKNIFPDLRGAGHWWFSLCAVVPAAFY